MSFQALKLLSLSIILLYDLYTTLKFMCLYILLSEIRHA